MKFYAIFNVHREVHVEIDAHDWQEAAEKALSLPPQTARAALERIGIIINQDQAEYYDATHEVVGKCNKCERYIFDGCDKDNCSIQHAGDGGWVSTEHGHIVWCCQKCRDNDYKNDPETDRR